MNLIAHREYVIGLVEGSAPQAEIKSALLAMREEVEGYEAASANQASLNQKHSDEVSALSKQIADLQRQNTSPESKPQREEKRIHRGIEFRKTSFTGWQWQPFCPNCGMPVNDVTMPTGKARWALCSKHCGWTGVELDLRGSIDAIIAEIPA
jgi:hypothetical protein